MLCPPQFQKNCLCICPQTCCFVNGCLKTGLFIRFIRLCNDFNRFRSRFGVCGLPRSIDTDASGAFMVHSFLRHVDIIGFQFGGKTFVLVVFFKDKIIEYRCNGLVKHLDQSRWTWQIPSM